MQSWTITNWDHVNAAAKTPTRSHATEATLVQILDTQVDMQANLCTDTSLPTAQAPPRSEFTESDTELLAACELYDASHITQPSHPRAQTTLNSH